jgi:hypothetical protein
MTNAMNAMNAGNARALPNIMGKRTPEKLP